MRFQKWLVVIALANVWAARTPAAACTARSPEAARSGSATAAAADRQRRWEAAVTLERQGFHVDWRLASWTELHDWTLRADEARRLRHQYGVRVDWRDYSFRELQDWRNRASRAAALRRLGVEVDWRLYTAAQLEEMRVFLEHARLQPPSPPLTDPEDIAETVTVGDDPDGTLLPTFLSEELSRADSDEDEILEPTLVHTRHRPARLRRAPLSKKAGGRGHGVDGATASATSKRDR